ncbi:hypothetical protein [Nocardioides campestrisoli]|uniref:hypothetical protein n=1 Tax=Nocardioides campestrisoli TaxID=2736757 RepID=UPI00163D775B|nr:hypothetical protein [Nocardioides campestrisoli]
MTARDEKRSLGATILSSVAAGAVATLVAGLLIWLIDEEVTVFFLAVYGALMTLFFFVMRLRKQRD